jgi:hypothetical protein
VFVSNLLTSGTFLWRLHLTDKDVFCMNSYDADGQLMPMHFVHTTREKLDNGSTLYQCSCSAYNLIHSVLLQHHHSEPDEEILPEGAACMHCKFLKEHVEQHIDRFFSEHYSCETPVFKKLKDSTCSLNASVVSLLQTKLSVVPRDSDCCSIVHISADEIVTCKSGSCQSSIRSCRKAVNGLLSLTEASKLCPHLEAMRSNQEAWSVPGSSSDISPDNTEDIDILQKPTQVRKLCLLFDYFKF